MDPRNKTYIPLIIIFFIFGVVLGYVAHKPATIEKPVYINNTVEKIVEKVVQVTVTPTPIPTVAATTVETPAISDFTVRNYDPSTDVTTKTILLRNMGADPDTLSIRPGDTVLIQITDYTLQNPLRLILNASYQRDMGTSGAVVVTFNKRGTYSLKAFIISSTDPNILPRLYGEGTITVY